MPKLPIIVDTIAGLRALTGSSGGTVIVASYYTMVSNVPDGGGGTFYWTSDLLTSDDSGTVIVPTALPRVGCWKRLATGSTLHVKWFGAKGDGVTDDTAAIQATVAQLDHYETLEFDQGTYLIKDGLDLTEKLFIKIEGNYAVLKAMDDANWPVATTKTMINLCGSALPKVNNLLICTDITPPPTFMPAAAIVLGRGGTGFTGGGVKLEEVRIDGYFSSCLLYNVSSELMQADQCWFFQYADAPTYMDTNYDELGLGIGAAITSNVTKTFYSSSLLNAGDAVVVALPGHQQELRFHDCYFYKSSAVSGFFISAYNSPYGLNNSYYLGLENCRAEGVTASGIRFLSVRNHEMIGCTIKSLNLTNICDYAVEVGPNGLLEYSDLKLLRTSSITGPKRFIHVDNGGGLYYNTILSPPESIHVETGGVTSKNQIYVVAGQTGGYGAYTDDWPFTSTSVQPNSLMNMNTGVDTVGSFGVSKFFSQRGKELSVIGNTAIPSIGYFDHYTEESTVPTTITGLALAATGDHLRGKELTLTFRYGNTSIAHGNNIILQSGAAWTNIPANSQITFAWENRTAAAGVWVEKSRMVATGNTYIVPNDFEVTDSGHGIILKSADGTRYRITVLNGGALNTAVV